MQLVIYVHMLKLQEHCLTAVKAIYIIHLNSFTQSNNLSDSEVVIIAVCASVGGIIIGKKMYRLELCFYSCYYFSNYSDFDCGCND